jgi:uncharacterized protein YecT (DUF1311 family)
MNQNIVSANSRVGSFYPVLTPVFGMDSQNCIVRMNLKSCLLAAVYVLVIGTSRLYADDIQSLADEPSFNCETAQSASEKMICRDRTLARRDRQMGNIYEYLLYILPENQKENFQQEQRDWLQRRDQECAVDKNQCVDEYGSRITLLQLRMTKLPKPDLPTLMKLLKEPNRHLHYIAERHLCGMGPAALTAAPELMSGLESFSRGERRARLECLLRMDPSNAMQYVMKYMETVDIQTDLDRRHLEELKARMEQLSAKGKREHLTAAEISELEKDHAAIGPFLTEFKGLVGEKKWSLHKRQEILGIALLPENFRRCGQDSECVAVPDPDDCTSCACPKYINIRYKETYLSGYKARCGPQNSTQNCPAPCAATHPECFSGSGPGTLTGRCEAVQN